MNKIKELFLTIKFKEDITFCDLPQSLSYALNMYFLGQKKLMDFHAEKYIKMYSYSHVIPKKNKYSKEDIGTFKIRFFDNEIFADFEKELYIRENPVFSVISITSKYFTPGDFNIIKTDTPAVITIHKKYWIPNNEELDCIKDRIINNTIKKYNILNKTNEGYYDFIEKIELVTKNFKPYSFTYKKGKILANKFILHIKQDAKSKEIASVMFGAGLLEKNSLSFGFVSPMEVI